MTWFTEALRQDPENPTIAKETANAALELGQFELGVALLRPATLQRPEDPVLHYDLAVQLLLSGHPNEAYSSLEVAARLEAHRDTARLMNYVEKVLTGRKPCPRSVHELQQGA
jgi:Flp pilus assembly protein TadD